MAKNNNRFVIIVASLTLAGCANIPLQPTAQNIMVTTNPAPINCNYQGQVTTDQGDFYTGPLTPSSMLEKNAMNDLRNQANSMGANYIAITSQTTTKPITQGTDGPNVAYHIQGNAYYCPNIKNKMY